MIEIATDNDSYAYAIFETMNDRGKPLSPVDMLKAYLLAPIPAVGLKGIWWAVPIGWVLADLAGLVRMEPNILNRELPIDEEEALIRREIDVPHRSGAAPGARP